MKIAVVCAPGVGDAVILQIASHHLSLAGHEVITVSPHRFGKWLPSAQFGNPNDCDVIFLQHDNSDRSKEIHQSNKTVYTFYGTHKPSKHGPLRAGFDFVCDLDQTMVDNMIEAMNFLFQIRAGPENGLTPPPGLLHRRYKKRIAIHTTSGNPDRNWPHEKFERFAQQMEKEGYEPIFLPQFSALEELTSFVYESGFFLGNDSGPGHIASCLRIPNLIIGREERHMRHWRPGWGGEIITPPRWVPNWKGLRLREKYWKKFITTKGVIKAFKNNILNN